MSCPAQQTSMVTVSAESSENSCPFEQVCISSPDLWHQETQASVTGLWSRSAPLQWLTGAVNSPNNCMNINFNLAIRTSDRNPFCPKSLYSQAVGTCWTSQMFEKCWKTHIYPGYGIKITSLYCLQQGPHIPWGSPSHKVESQAYSVLQWPLDLGWFEIKRSKGKLGGSEE